MKKANIILLTGQSNAVGVGLTTKNEPTDAPDVAHYDSDSTVKLGELFAEPLVL